MLIIGACFDTQLATLLRHVAAASLVAASVGLVVWHYLRAPGIAPVAIVALMCGVALAYLRIVRRLGWIYVLGVHASCLLGILGFDGYHAGTFSGGNLPIQSGLICFCIGVTISTVKTGLCRKVWLREPQPCQRAVYRSGW